MSKEQQLLRKYELMIGQLKEEKKQLNREIERLVKELKNAYRKSSEPISKPEIRTEPKAEPNYCGGCGKPIASGIPFCVDEDGDTEQECWDKFCIKTWGVVETKGYNQKELKKKRYKKK